MLPTGLGKTGIALMLAAQRCKQYPGKKVLVLAPTKPLAEQHLVTFQKHLEAEDAKFALLTGETSPEQRTVLWREATYFFSTPQTVENDIINQLVNFGDFCLLVVDEAHRAVGEYAYVWVTKQFVALSPFPRVLALTASPGSELKTIQDVCANLFLEDVEVRTVDDADVQPYVQPVSIMWDSVELSPELLEIKRLLERASVQRVQELKRFGQVNSSLLTKKELLAAQVELRRVATSGEKSYEVLKSLSLLAEITKLQHALELVETQSVFALCEYCDKLVKDAGAGKVKATKNIVEDVYFKTVWVKAKQLVERGVIHPKMARLRDIVSMHKDEKMIIFTQFRDSAVEIKRVLDGIPVVSHIFVGQAKKKGLGISQKRQIELLDEFKNGDFSVLIATTVGEEGLDIPQVDRVIFYEPVPSAIRTIQRRGRTGRNDEGAITVLVAKNTRDEGYRWSAHHKERRMYSFLKDLRKHVTPHLAQKELSSYAAQDSLKSILVYADHREKTGHVVRELMDLGVALRLEQLDAADYVVSERCGIEFKTVDDFANSLIDGRLLEQVRQLRNNFVKPLVIVEGEQDVSAVRNIHPNAVRGMWAAITVGFGVPVLRTKNAKDSAAMISVIARREQDELGNNFSPHASKRVRSLSEQQEYLVSAFPGVGLAIARELLAHFKTVERVMTATVEELMGVSGIGKVLAERIREVATVEYLKKVK